MKLSKLLEKLEYEVVSGSVDVEVGQLLIDSRKVQKGDVFVAISGAVRDAHDFVPSVCEAGAGAVIVEKDVNVSTAATIIKVADTRYALACMAAAFYDYPASKLTTIGVTGTKGKTTTTYMVRSVLEGIGIKTGLIGTIETIISEDQPRIPSENTTPESLLVQEYFARMVEAGCKAVVMEVSSQGLMLHRVAGFTFDYGVYTNLSPDHIGPNEHKDFEDYMNCKAMLFRNCKHGIILLCSKTGALILIREQPGKNSALLIVIKEYRFLSLNIKDEKYRDWNHNNKRRNYPLITQLCDVKHTNKNKGKNQCSRKIRLL